MATDVNDPWDPLLNAWAQAWVLHQLPRDPLHLFDANIFFPERNTLAYSESLIVPALLTAPVRWVGGSPLVAYNVSMLLAFALSGFATALLVRHLTGSIGAGILSGVVFAFLPFRIDHYAHLQLQWVPWIPFTLLALHHLMVHGRLRDGVVLGAAWAAQALSCVYYAVFFSIVLGPILIGGALRAIDPVAAGRLLLPPLRRPGWRWVLLAIQVTAVVYFALAWISRRGGFNLRLPMVRVTVHDASKMLFIGAVMLTAAVLLRWLAGAHVERRPLLKPWLRGAQVRALAVSAVVALGLVTPVLGAYLGARQTVGERGRTEIAGALPGDYLVAPEANRLYGGRARPEQNERRLFMGLVPVALALVGLWRCRSPRPWIYAAGTLLAFDLSLGLNGFTYDWMYRWVLPLRAIRVAARAGLLVGFGVAVLAGFGVAKLSARAWRRPVRLAIAPALCVLCLAEFWSVPVEPLERIPPDVPAVYRALATVTPPANVVELPAGRNDPRYMYYSTLHWHRLLNGYSGFFPPSYHELGERLKAFPAPDVIDYLRRRQVDYVVDHTGGDVKTRIASGLVPVQTFTGGRFPTVLYRLREDEAR